MKKLILALLSFLFINLAEAAEQKPVRFDFQAANVAQVVQLVYTEALKMPYVIEPQVLQDSRTVSFRFDSAKGDLHAFWRSFLDTLGYTVDTRAGVDFVHTKPPEQKAEQESEVFIYRPRYREASYLADLLGQLFKAGGFTANRSVKAPPQERSDKAAPAGSAAALIDHDADTLIYQGTQAEIAKLKKLLPQVDTPTGEVFVKGAVYEVSTGQDRETGFHLALSLLGGKLGINIGAPTNGDHAISFKAGGIDTAIGALAGDSRFKVVSTPYLRVRSGRNASLTVGQDVPILGSVSYPQGGGTPVRSVDYKSSGVIFNITPNVRENVIDLDVSQQVSNFVKTETGVDDSPTLIKRELRTNVSAKDGELIVLGGLRDEKDNSSRSGPSFLPDFMHTKSRSQNQTEILLMLQLSKAVD